MSEGEKIRVGLVGFGMVCKVFHGPLVSSHPNFELTHIVQRGEPTAKSLYPTASVVKSVDDLIASDVELVVVATPSGSHHEHAKKALEAGKHVVVEKPFTVTVAEAEELIALAKAKKRVLTVFHNRRWDSDFKTVTRLVGAGVLGKLYEIDIHYDRFRTAFRDNWRDQEVAGSGILFDLGSHIVDQALRLVGTVPSAVFADVRRQRPNAPATDYFDLDLRFDHAPHLKVTVRAGMLVRCGGPRYALHGDKGSFLKHGLDVQEDALKAGHTPGTPSWGKEPPHIWGKLHTDVGGVVVEGVVQSEVGSYQDFYSNVFAAVRSGAELGVKPEEAMEVIRVIEMATKSAKEGRLVRRDE